MISACNVTNSPSNTHSADRPRTDFLSSTIITIPSSRTTHGHPRVPHNPGRDAAIVVAIVFSPSRRGTYGKRSLCERPAKPLG